MKIGDGLRSGDSASRCAWLQGRLGAYLDGTLSAHAMRRAVSHMAECESCRDEAARLEASLVAVREFRQVLPQPGFEEAVWNRIRLAREVSRPAMVTGRVLGNRLLFDRRSLGVGIATLAAAASLLAFVTVRTGVLPFRSGNGDVARVAEETPLTTPAANSAAGESAPAAGLLASGDTPSESASPVTDGEIPAPVGYGEGYAMSDQPGVYSDWQTPTPVGLDLGGGTTPRYRYDRVERIQNPNAPGGDYLVIRRVVQQRQGTSGDGRLSF
jgi:anti-sigma factor RsiW